MAEVDSTYISIPDVAPHNSREVQDSETSLAHAYEVVAALDPIILRMIQPDKPYLVPQQKIWQPGMLLPESQDNDIFIPGIMKLREQAANLDDALIVVLAGNEVTEEALPNYSNWLTKMQVTGDPTGVGEGGFARWDRAWTAEENRHGDVLNKYLYLSGRVDTNALARTTNSLISNGMDIQASNHPYEAFSYTTFQELATKMSHRNVAELAKQQGAPDLAKICGAVGGDENRHYAFYRDVMGLVFDQDPNAAMLAYDRVLKSGIVMPAALMTDGEYRSSGEGVSDLFNKYAIVAEATGVYDGHGYASVMRDLNAAWKIGERSVHGDAAKAQEDIMRRPRLVDAMAERRKSKNIQQNPILEFKWLYGRSVQLPPPHVLIKSK